MWILLGYVCASIEGMSVSDTDWYGYDSRLEVSMLHSYWWTAYFLFSFQSAGARWETTRTTRFCDRSQKFGGFNKGTPFLCEHVIFFHNVGILGVKWLIIVQIQLKYLAEEMQAVSKGIEKVLQELTASENDGPVSENFCKVTMCINYSYQIYDGSFICLCIFLNIPHALHAMMFKIS